MLRRDPRPRATVTRRSKSVLDNPAPFAQQRRHVLDNDEARLERVGDGNEVEKQRRPLTVHKTRLPARRGYVLAWWASKEAIYRLGTIGDQRAMPAQHLDAVLVLLAKPDGASAKVTLGGEVHRADP